MQRTAAWLAAMCLFFVASCSTTEADSSNTVDTSTALAATPSVPETTPPEPTTTLESEPTELVEPTEPPAFAELPLLALTEVPSTWLEPAYIDDFAIIGTPVVLPGTRSMLIIEQRGQVEEGCEGGIEPFGRLVSVDLDSRSSTTLIPELELTDTRLVAGRDGRFALVGGCDANAWLAGVGRLSVDGTLAFQRLGVDREDRIPGGGNAGVSVTWADRGEVLFFDSIRVDASTGDRLDPIEEAPRVRVHAELADGTRLVSAPSDGFHHQFWVDDGSASLDDVMSTPPDFSAQSGYPAVQVRIDAAGERAYAVFEDWEAGTVETAIIGGAELMRIEGRAVPSPSGTHLLVDSSISGEWSDWSVVDLATGTMAPVPLPVSSEGNWVVVTWGGTDDEFLVSVAELTETSLPPSGVWLLTAS